MLFNSIGFIFAFLPLVLLAYHLLARTRFAFLRRGVLILSTLVFYGLGGWEYVPLLLASVAFNYVAGRLVFASAEKPRQQAIVLTAAIIGNVLVLGYFKYFNFLLRSLNTVMESGFQIELIALPLGISFFTFQQIGYLVDVSRGKIKPGSPLDYAGFVLFFPQLLAGPIVYFRETVPQMQQTLARGTVGRNILIGLVIFAIGLFKKTVVADTAALYASPVFTAAREGGAVGLLDTWVAAFAYTAQVYFDFSGYSDMAIGTARMFGIILPLNFHSPLRSKSVVEIWRRWHITLGRWVQSYVFQPISLPLTRIAANRGLEKYGSLLLGVLIPTIISMLVVGVWHGAGWTFVLFGLMHGIYMAVNELWATVRKKARKARKKAKLPAPAWHGPLACAATLVAFVLTIIPFGTPRLETAGAMFAAMAGLGPAFILPADWPLGTTGGVLTVLALYLAIFIVPNTQQIMGRFEPVLDWSSQWSKIGHSPVMAEWKMTTGWALASAMILFLGIAFIMRGTTEFIYFNF